jgi:hypothetical protein
VPGEQDRKLGPLNLTPWLGTATYPFRLMGVHWAHQGDVNIGLVHPLTRSPIPRRQTVAAWRAGEQGGGAASGRAASRHRSPSCFSITVRFRPVHRPAHPDGTPDLPIHLPRTTSWTSGRRSSRGTPGDATRPGGRARRAVQLLTRVWVPRAPPRRARRVAPATGRSRILHFEILYIERIHVRERRIFDLRRDARREDPIERTVDAGGAANLINQ